MAKLTVKDVDLKGKKVLVRVDFNVPVKDGVITNDNRITAALPTIKYILEQGGRAILFSHLGRVKEEADKEGKSLAPVAADLAAKLGQDVKFIPGVTRGAELEAAVNALEDGQVLLVENTRFEDLDGKKESKNEAVQAVVAERMDDRDIHIGPSDYVPWQDDNKLCFLRMEGRTFGDVPMNIELRLSVEDSPNSAGCVIDAVRCCKLGLERGIGGQLTSISSYVMKHPPVQVTDDEAYENVEKFISGDLER